MDTLATGRLAPMVANLPVGRLHPGVYLPVGILQPGAYIPVGKLHTYGSLRKGPLVRPPVLVKIISIIFGIKFKKSFAAEYFPELFCYTTRNF